MFTAYYDLARNPPTYDTVTFLLRVEMERLRLNEQDVAIEILPGPDHGFRKDTVWPRSTEIRRELLNNIVVPMCYLLPSVKRVTLHHERPANVQGFGVNAYMIPFNGFVAAMRKGIRPLRPRLQHSGVCVIDSKLITMTLRECEHHSKRNSNVQEWYYARDRLEEEYDVVLIPDTFRADEYFDPLDSMSMRGFEAAQNLHERASLYRRAVCNLFVGNGPAWFSYALDAPTVVMRPVTDGAGWLYSAAAFEGFGVPRRGQIPGTGDRQRLIWENDSAHAIVNACLQFLQPAQEEVV